MTEMQLREILCDAMVKEYEWIPAPENLRHDYTFSPEFEKKIKKMMQKYGSGIKQNTYFKCTRDSNIIRNMIFESVDMPSGN